MEAGKPGNDGRAGMPGNDGRPEENPSDSPADAAGGAKLLNVGSPPSALPANRPPNATPAGTLDKPSDRPVLLGVKKDVGMVSGALLAVAGAASGAADGIPVPREAPSDGMGAPSAGKDVPKVGSALLLLGLDVGRDGPPAAPNKLGSPELAGNDNPNAPTPDSIALEVGAEEGGALPKPPRAPLLAAATGAARAGTVVINVVDVTVGSVAIGREGSAGMGSRLDVGAGAGVSSIRGMVARDVETGNADTAGAAMGTDSGGSATGAGAGVAAGGGAGGAAAAGGGEDAFTPFAALLPPCSNAAYSDLTCCMYLSAMPLQSSCGLSTATRATARAKAAFASVSDLRNAELRSGAAVRLSVCAWDEGGNARAAAAAAGGGDGDDATGMGARVSIGSAGS